jgi:hypothetical protein
MPITDRELAIGTKLVGTHKKTAYVCEVVTTPEGKTAFQLEDGRIFNSPSSAGKAVMNGVACNGWRFWSVEGTELAKAEKPAKASKPKQPNGPKRLRLIKKLRSQKDAPEGQTGWFCSACMKGFHMPTGQEPATCPEGHPWEVDDEFETAS